MASQTYSSLSISIVRPKQSVEGSPPRASVAIGGAYPVEFPITHVGLERVFKQIKSAITRKD